MLTEKETVRYNRHLLLPEIGAEGQEKLKHAKVLVIGAGGLGCPVLMYLAAAGTGTLGILDFDNVDISNLQRQVLYGTDDLGKSKALIAKQKLSAQNPLIRIESINTKLSTQNALDIFSGYDIIVDGTDNFSTRYLVNDACLLLGKILVSGAVFKFQGQAAVFNFPSAEGRGPSYRCLFPSPPPPESSPSCSEAGVMGVLPGIIGTLMANEVIKIITGVGEVLSGKMLLMDSLTLDFQTVTIERNPEAILSAPQTAAEFTKMNYDHFCGVEKSASGLKEITSGELLEMISRNENIQLLDVREPLEQPSVPELRALHIPLGDIENQRARIAADKKVIVLCAMGTRSRKAIELLSDKHGFQNLYNLKGGVMEWIRTRSKQQKA